MISMSIQIPHLRAGKLTTESVISCLLDSVLQNVWAHSNMDMIQNCIYHLASISSVQWSMMAFGVWLFQCQFRSCNSPQKDWEDSFLQCTVSTYSKWLQKSLGKDWKTIYFAYIKNYKALPQGDPCSPLIRGSGLWTDLKLDEKLQYFSILQPMSVSSEAALFCFFFCSTRQVSQVTPGLGHLSCS